MTIKMQNVTIDHDARAEALDAVRRGATDITLDETHAVDLLAVVRHIMRDRDDCTMVPVVRAAVRFETNEYGHNGMVEVTYDNRGHRAIYGVHFGARVTRVQCYMD